MERLARFRAYLPDVDDVLGLAGSTALLHGIALIYVPAAWIVAGLLAITAAVLIARKAS